MAKIKLNPDQIDSVIIKDVKKQYKLIVAHLNKNDEDYTMLDAMEQILKYYMIESEATKWCKNQWKDKP